MLTVPLMTQCLTQNGAVTSTSGEASNGGSTPAPPTTAAGRSRSSQIPIPRSTDNLILTVLMMVLCGLMLNVLAFAFLVPALHYSGKVRRYTN